jgi:hypothetical protein
MRGALLGILAGTALAFTAAQPAAAATIAAGSTVSVTGNVIVNPTNQDVSQATSLDFTDGSYTPSLGTAGPVSSYSGTGTFLGDVCVGSCGTIQDILSLVPGAVSIPNFFLLSGGTGPASISFSLNNISSIVRTPGFLDVTATGTLSATGFDSTPGLFRFSTQGGNMVTFSATTTAVPEPATWALMLLGFGGIGLAMRRRRRPALAQIA